MEAPVKKLARALFISASLFAWTSSTPSFAQHQNLQVEAKQDTTRPFMRAKLAGSQNVLDGIVTENFQLIRSGAEGMKSMSEAVQWPSSDDKVYEHFGKEFRRQCDKLIKSADSRDLEGAHYTFLGMTTTCINCHNYVRSAFRVEQNPDDPKGPVRLIPTDWEGKARRTERSADATQELRGK